VQQQLPEHQLSASQHSCWFSSYKGKRYEMEELTWEWNQPVSWQETDLCAR